MKTGNLVVHQPVISRQNLTSLIYNQNKRKTSNQQRIGLKQAGPDRTTQVFVLQTQHKKHIKNEQYSHKYMKALLLDPVFVFQDIMKYLWMTFI